MKRNRLILFLSVVTLFFTAVSCAGSKTSAFKEICDNGTDDDGDGFIDCADSDCVSFSACGQTGKEIMCTDGTDNDGDGFIDCADPDCATSTACNSSGKELICTDGTDNDGDGLIDCTDPDCALSAACSSGNEIICTDGTDNDGDGLIDCADPDCVSASACNGGNSEICNDGTDNDGDGAIDCADLDCIGQTGTGGITCQQQEADCADGGDNDGDGLIDCDDPDCASFALCNNQCTEDTVYYSSPPTCPSGYQCGINPDNEAQCLENAAFSAGTFYGACGSNFECPFGSICAGNPGVCMPFCKYENNTLTHDCPDNGLCFYTLTDTTINLCQGVSNCDLVDSHDCATDEGCFMEGGYTYCLPDSVGTVARGDDCSNGICEAGNICLNLGYADKCYKYCDYPGGYCPVGQQCYDGSSITGFPAGYGYCDSVSK